MGGTPVETKNGRTAPVVDPSTGETFAQAPLSGPDDVQAALEAARAAFVSWRRTTPGERSLALIRIAGALEARADELVGAECQNTGKPFALTMSEEIRPMVDQVRFFAGAARLLEGRAAAEYMAGHTSYIRREPIGVCAAVTPWNYPMMMAPPFFRGEVLNRNTMTLVPEDVGTPVGLFGIQPEERTPEDAPR